MDKAKDTTAKEEVLHWTCELSPTDKEPLTVGEVKTLKCSGFDFAPIKEKYSVKLEDEYENAVKILSIKKDSQSLKEFEVTSYMPIKGDVKIKIQSSGETIFESVVKGLNVKSSIQNPKDPKTISPQLGYYILPGVYEIILMGAFIVACLIFMFIRFRKKLKTSREFKRVLSQAKYADPFMDFNVEMRDYIGQKNPSALFLKLLDDSLKKVFFRIFESVVSLQDLDVLVKRLRVLGLEEHEIRNFYILHGEYKKFRNLYESKKNQAFEEKKEFLEQVKKTINSLRQYVEGDS